MFFRNDDVVVFCVLPYADYGHVLHDMVVHRREENRAVVFGARAFSLSEDKCHKHSPSVSGDDAIYE